MTREHWRAECREIRINGEYITFYHGTAERFASGIRTNGVDLEHVKRDMDFGRGVYATVLKEQVASWADSIGKRNHESGDVVVFDVPKSAFDAMNNRRFETTNSEWGAFVRDSRNGLQTDYDTISGPYLSNLYQFRKGAANSISHAQSHQYFKSKYEEIEQ